MVHREVFRLFEQYFPDYAKSRFDVYFPNGQNSIRVRLNNREEFIFTYNSKKDWSLETVDSYIKKMKKGRKR